MRKTISETGETRKLIIRESVLGECEELKKVLMSWENHRLMTGDEIDPESMYKCITEGDLPPVPDASKDYYRIKSVSLKETGEIIGLVDMYHGYPNDQTLWIGTFIIDSQYKGKGYGQEVVEFVSQEAKKAGYQRIGIGVYLKNWPALRFWTKAGFDKITGVYGDKIYSENTFALVGLSKEV